MLCTVESLKNFLTENFLGSRVFMTAESFIFFKTNPFDKNKKITEKIDAQ